MDLIRNVRYWTCTFILSILFIGQANSIEISIDSLSAETTKFEYRSGFDRWTQYLAPESWQFYLLDDKGWKFKLGDNPQYAAPNYNDQDWKDIKTTRMLRLSLSEQEQTGICWFRLEVTVDSTLLDQPLAFLYDHIGGASEIFINGHLAYKFGKVGKSQVEENPYRAFFWKDVKSIRFQKTSKQVIAVRYSDTLAPYFSRHGYPYIGFTIALGKMPDAIAYILKMNRGASAYQVLFTSIALTLALTHLLLFLFYRDRQENLYMSVYSGLYAGMAFMYARKPLNLTQESMLFQDILTTCSLVVVPLAAIGLLYNLFYKKLPRIFWIILSISTLILLYYAQFLFFQQTDTSFFSQVYVQIFFFILLIEIVRITIVGILRKQAGAWIISIGTLLLCTSIAHEILVVNSVIKPLFGYSFGYGFLALLLSVSIYLARDFAYTHKNLAVQLDRVQELSDEIVREEVQRQLLESDNQRKTQELEEARKLSLLPETTPKLPYIDIAWYMKTATEVGGDYYDYIIEDDQTLTLALGDATGHGLQSGLVVTATKSLFQSVAHQPDPHQALSTMSQSLKRMQLPHLGMAMVMLKIHAQQFKISSAGMPPLLHYNATTQTVEEILIEGMPLGYSNMFPYEQMTRQLMPGDALLLMSDGLPELMNPDDEWFGYDRLLTHFAQIAHKTPRDICDSLVDIGNQWANGREQDDDISLIAMQIRAT